jgi:alpha-D-xyloside xylohydrolase
MIRSSSLAYPAAVSLALLFAGSAFAAEGSFQRTPDGIVVTPAAGPAKQVRLQVMSDRIIHVTAMPTAAAKIPESLMVVAKPHPPATLKVDERAGVVIVNAGRATAEVSLADGIVRFRDAKGRPVLAERDAGRFTPVTVEGQSFYRLTQQFNPGTDESFYGLGQHQNRQMDYNGQDVELSQYNRDIAVPFVLSSRGYGVLWDNNAISRFGDPTPYGMASRDLKIFDASGKPGGFTAKYYVNGALKLTRTEKDIDYQYLKDLVTWPAQLSDKAPDPQAHAPWGPVKVVWEGAVETPHPGVHKFQLYSSGYAKLWLDGNLVIDRWRQNWNPWFHDFEARLAPGKRHSIRVEWTPDDGYVALLHNNPLPEPERHSLQLTSELGQAIDYYFIAGDDLDDVVTGYRQLTGKAVLAPRWAYGFWQSRQRYETADQLLGVVKEYRQRKLPLDNIVMDWRYWKDPEWGSHRFDETRFPDPKGMIDQIHALNAHFMISVWPKFYPTTDHYKELDAAGFMYHRNIEQGAKDWVGPGYLNSFYDPYAKTARDIYWRQIKDSLKGLGVDAWWLDASEPDMHSNMDVAERTRRMSPTAIGPGAAYFNSYSLPHTEGVYAGERAYAPDVRPFILTRSGFAGLQRNGAAVWSGDIVARWDDLRDQISAGVNLSMSGIPNWTTDIGGFSVEKRYESQDPAHLEEWRELNLRWFQFGAFSPLFRSHGEFPYREIYNLAPEGSEVYRALAWYDELRYRLMPYIYTTAAETYHHDGAIMRGLVMDFPDDPAVRKIDDEYLFGRAFLAAPVTRFKARSRSVYLPSGASWYDFETGRLYPGGRGVEAPAPLARMPLFVRAGAIVPMGPVQQYVGEKAGAPITLVVFTGHDGRFELYEDDGLSNGYERGAFSRIPISWDQASGRLTIGARTGTFTGMAERRVFKVRFIADGVSPTGFDAADATVDYAGAPVTVAQKR